MLRRSDPRRVATATQQLVVPEAAWKTCPWEPREPIEAALRQWLRCCGAALADRQVIGMPSRAVDELWHGLILCTARYERFCDAAYGRLLHHRPEGDHGPPGVPDRFGAPPPRGPHARLRRALLPPPPQAGSMREQLRRTQRAWELVARPGEACLLWRVDLDVGVEQPWTPSGRPPE